MPVKRSESPVSGRRLRIWASVFLLALSLPAARAAEERAATAHDWPAISIVIDDLGGRYQATLRAIALPGPVACSFLPYGEHTRRLAVVAYRRGKEVMLHLPMQTIGDRPLDRGGLTMDMTRQEFLRTLQQDIDAVPHASGVNNHMGSLLTQHAGDMLWLMRAIRRHGGLFFLDSRTTAQTVAMQMALETHVPTMKRDVFLDDDRSPEAIRAQFERLIRLAKIHGTALAIGHPYAHTFQMLEEVLPTLSARGVRLVPVAEMIRLQQQRRESWQASLSPSPKDARNSKPSP